MKYFEAQIVINYVDGETVADSVVVYCIDESEVEDKVYELYHEDDEIENVEVLEFRDGDNNICVV
jgi:hypothetical protein